MSRGDTYDSSAHWEHRSHRTSTNSGRVRACERNEFASWCRREWMKMRTGLRIARVWMGMDALTLIRGK